MRPTPKYASLAKGFVSGPTKALLRPLLLVITLVTVRLHVPAGGALKRSTLGIAEFAAAFFRLCDTNGALGFQNTNTLSCACTVKEM